MASNILFSTTRSWNIGDEFILFGVRRLLAPHLGAINPIIFNRNPAVQMPHHALRHTRLQTGDGNEIVLDLSQSMPARQRLLDNSWNDTHGLRGLDYCVFAGTPEWSNFPVESLTAALAASDTPVLYLGIGASDSPVPTSIEGLPDADKTLLQRARLITTRDPKCQTFLQPVPSHHLPCPALFCAPDMVPRERPRRFGIVYQKPYADADQRGPTSYDDAHNVPKPVSDRLAALAADLKSHGPVGIICHYAEEYMDALGRFGADYDIHYSYDARDYFDIYGQFDVVATARVHGAGIASSLGVASVFFTHSQRHHTVDGFLSVKIDAEALSVEEISAQVRAVDTVKQWDILAAHKEQTAECYAALLGPALS